MASGWQRSIRARKRAQRSRPHEWAGYRRHTVARSTGALVVLVDGWAQGLSSPPDPGDQDFGDGRWFLICDDHSSILSGDIQSELRPHMSNPEGWCEECRKVTHGPDPSFVQSTPGRMTMTSLAFGYNQGLPDDVTAAWGARMIVTQDGHVDLVGNRTDWFGETLPLLTWLNTVALDGAITAARQKLKDGEIRTREAAEVVLYEDDKGRIVGNSNASAGYLYVTAYLFADVT